MNTTANFWFGIAAALAFAGWSVMIFAAGWEAGRNNVLKYLVKIPKEDKSNDAS